MPTKIRTLAAAFFLLFATTMVAQSATGNVAQSGPYAQWELYDAQNPPSRNFEGCIVRYQQEFWLYPKKGDPLLLNYIGKQDLSALEGAHVKLRGRENIGAGRRKDSTNLRLAGKEGKQYVMRTETIIDNEINVERFEVVSNSCPDWDQGN